MQKADNDAQKVIVNPKKEESRRSSKICEVLAGPHLAVVLPGGYRREGRGCLESRCKKKSGGAIARQPEA